MDLDERLDVAVTIFCQFIQGSLGQTNFPIVAITAVTSEALKKWF